MRKFTFVLSLFSVLSAVSTLTVAADSAAPITVAAKHSNVAATCNVTRPTAIRTDFPQASQSRGEHGDVVLKITISKDGRSAATQVARSSGFPSLDKAAIDSVLRHWRFDVAHCTATELPSDSFVTVQFQRAPQYTLYGTMTKHRATPDSGYKQSRCDTARDAFGDQIIACLSDASLAGRDNQPSLASATTSNPSK
jgi:TonB family protein